MDLKDSGMCEHVRLGPMAKKLCPTACAVCVSIGEKTHDLHKMMATQVRDSTFRQLFI